MVAAIADIDRKQRVQNVLFPNGLKYYPETGILNSDSDCLFSQLEDFVCGKSWRVLRDSTPDLLIRSPILGLKRKKIKAQGRKIQQTTEESATQVQPFHDGPPTSFLCKVNNNAQFHCVPNLSSRCT